MAMMTWSLLTGGAGISSMVSFEVLEAWHLTAVEHVALVRDVLIPVARLHASIDLAYSGALCSLFSSLDVQHCMLPVHSAQLCCMH